MPKPMTAPQVLKQLEQQGDEKMRARRPLVLPRCFPEGILMKLTQTQIAKLELPRGKADAIFFDDEMPSFGLRIRAGGSRKFIVQYRQGGLQRRYTLGPTAVLTLEQARHKARKVLVDVGEGKDPAAERDAQQAAAGLLFASAVDDYLKVCAQDLRPRTRAEYTRYLKELWKPLNKLALDKITLPLVANNLRTIAEKHSNTQANRARSCLSAMFAWAISEGMCGVNPVIGTSKKKENGSRTRVLTDAELAAVWRACPKSDFGAIIRLLMLTACRREEIAQLRWAEVDLNTKLITLPAARTKNGVEHVLPLSDTAMEVLQAIPYQRDVIFGHGRNGFGGFAKAKRVLDRTSGVSNWTVHDLRRTAATGMADIGVQPHVIEAVLNHVGGHKAGVAGIYNRATYAKEKREALDAWANHIRVAIAQASGANVTTLKSSK
jgi:integrase